MKTKKVSLCKNDPFGIKEKMFRFKLKKCIVKGIKPYTKSIIKYLLLLNKMPRGITEEEIEKEAEN